MKGWTLPLAMSLVIFTPFVAAASVEPLIIIAQTVSNLTDQTWELIRTAQLAATHYQPEQAAASLLQAEQTARQIENVTTREQLLAQIAAEQAKQGRYDRAIAITQSMSYQTQSEQTCCTPFRTEAELAIANAYIQAGQLRTAQQFAESIQLETSRNQVLLAVIAELANQGQIGEAIALRRQLQDDYQLGAAAYSIVKGYINNNQFTDALQFTRTISDVAGRESMLATLVQWAWRSGQYDTAYQIANEIHPSAGKGAVLSELAIAYAVNGQQTRAAEILSQAYQLAQMEPLSHAQWAGYFAQIGAFDRAIAIANGLEDYEKSEARLKIAQAYAEAGLFEQALAIAQQVRDGELQPFGDMDDPKVNTLNQVIRQALQAEQGDIALRTAQTMADEHRVRALLAIARYYRINQQPEKSTTVLDQAFEAAKSVDQIVIFYDRNTYFTVSNAGLLLDIARGYLSVRQTDPMLTVLSAATQSAQLLKESNPSSVQEQVRYLSAIAKLYSQADQKQQIPSIADAALQLVNQLPEENASPYFPRWKIEALANVAQIYTLADAGDRAEQVLSNVRRLTDSMTDSEQKAWAMMAIVQSYAATDQNQRLQATIDEALAVIQTLEPYQQTWLTSRLAVAAAASSDSSYASELIRQLPDWMQQASIWGEIAGNYLKAGLDPQGQAAVVSLQMLIDTIPDPGQRDQTLNQILNDQIISYSPYGSVDRSVWQLLQAGQINAGIKTPAMRAYNWLKIGLNYARQGEASRAREAIAFALEATQTVPDQFEQRDLLWQMFEEAARADEDELAAQITTGFAEPAYRTTALQRVNPQYP